VAAGDGNEADSTDDCGGFEDGGVEFERCHGQCGGGKGENGQGGYDGLHFQLIGDIIMDGQVMESGKFLWMKANEGLVGRGDRREQSKREMRENMKMKVIKRPHER
jgi:hypothetical protein